MSPRKLWADSRLAGSLPAAVIALLASGGLVAIAGISPLDAYSAIWTGGLGSTTALGTTAVTMLPLLFAALAFAVPFRAGLYNIGIEGQLYLGALASVVVGLKLDAPSRTALVRPALQTDAARRRRSRAPSALSILDAVPVPALITRGSAHRVEYANVAAKSILPDAGSGIELAQLFGAEPRRAVGRIADESFVSAAPGVARSVMLADLVRFGSTWRRADVFTTPMHDGAGKLAGLIVFLVDVTNDPPLRGSSPANAPSQLERERPA